MMRFFLRGAATLTLLLIGASVASAFPINNRTDTDANGPGLSGFGFNLVSTVTGNSVTTVGNTARAFSTVTNDWTRSGSSGSTSNTTGFTAAGLGQGGTAQTAQTLSEASYNALQPRNWTTFCLEITEGLNQNNIVTAIEQIPPAIALPDGVGYIAQADQAAALQRASWLIANRNNLAATYTGPPSITINANTIGAATQLAIWEIIYEAGVTSEGNVSTLNGNNRGLSVSGGTNTARNAAIALANHMLTETWNDGNVRTGTGYVFRSGIRFVGTSGANGTGDYLYREDTSSQSLITAVPEPSTFAIAGLSGLAMLGYGLRRRKMARN
ncbi:PEP-CTERM sorting domain-containing protein [Tautonia sp. JC769]|uniref:PEP-CTERM sorting domain-containing protein n=1 Tax=Tautonia sp. JC769 TaxID=3232135 RepID=UPI00345795C3